jgi:NAD(P)-dependent dehydrogenase (short-subunit alcohol dehydrogenase family)
MTSRAVLITGASTGIGRASALHLDRIGMTVFAGVRKAEDGEELRGHASDRLRVVLIDIADAASVEQATAEVLKETEGPGLFGLVNNAGITVQGPLEYLPPAQLREQFEVNVFGHMAVTQPLLPSLKKAQGRIVFMSSIAGRARSLPFLGPYSASKKAIGALADSLRIELRGAGISVSLVEPGSIATPIWEKGDASFDELLESLPPEGRTFYGAALDKARKIAAASGARGIPPERVAAKVAHALTAARPKARYLVGSDAMARAWVESPLPDRVRDKLLARLVGLDRKG